MGFFNSAKTPNTISDKELASLRRRAQKAAPDMLSSKAIKQRLASNAQQKNAHKS